MKTSIDFIGYVDEVLDKPYPYKWISKHKLKGPAIASRWKAVFKTDDGRIFDVKMALTWFEDVIPAVQRAQVIFSDVERGTQMTGLGDMFRILTTVGYILKDFTEQNPEVVALVFSSHGKGRTGVYRRLAKRLLGWELLSEKVRSVGNIPNAYTSFVMVRKNIKTDMKRALKEII
jgi:hypothetical protein